MIYLFSRYRALRLWLFRVLMRGGAWLVTKRGGDLTKFKAALWQSFADEASPAMRADYEKVFREVFG